MSCCNASSGLSIEIGSTFKQIYRWGGSPIVYKAISALVANAPLTFTVTGHGAPDGWPVAFTDVGGLDDLNASCWPPAKSDFKFATAVDANTIALNDIDGKRIGTYTSGGTMAYYSPIDLTSATVVFTLYTLDGSGNATQALQVNAAVDNTAKTITLILSSTVTAALAVGGYTYTLVATQSGAVTVLDEGQLTVVTPGTSNAPSP